MPTYEFRCPRGHEFEKFYRTIGGAEAQAVCPQCGLPAERVMSAAGFAFKGSGFYLTDYGKNAHREKGTPDARNGAAAGDGGAASGEPAKADAKSDAAPTPAAAASSGSSAESKPAAQPAKGESKGAESKPAAPAKKSATE
jgi:putative FmdB family regulatory protein